MELFKLLPGKDARIRFLGDPATPLQRVVFNDLAWRPGSFDDFENRLDRHRQLDLKPVMVHYFNGVKLEMKTKPVPIHKKRRHQSEAYHKRVQKKWDYRYGDTYFVPGPRVVIRMTAGFEKRLKAMAKKMVIFDEQG